MPIKAQGTLVARQGDLWPDRGQCSLRRAFLARFGDFESCQGSLNAPKAMPKGNFVAMNEFSTSKTLLTQKDVFLSCLAVALI